LDNRTLEEMRILARPSDREATYHI
jgi:hypothetical protein